jgi:MFS family permease
LTDNRRSQKVFFGWWTVLTGGLLSLWGHGFYTFGFSALFKPVSLELGFNRMVTSIPASIGRLQGGFEAPLAGWITDKYGPRRIVLAGVLMISLSLMLMYFVDSLWAFLLLWGVLLGSGINIATAVPMDTAIANWFVRKRGSAVSIKWVLSGLGGVILLPLIALLIEVQDWRITCVIGGAVMAVVGLPLAWFCMKDRRPEYYGLMPDGAKLDEETTDTDAILEKGVEYAAQVEEMEFTLRQAMRTPSYWLLLAAAACNGLAGPPLYIHIVPFLTDKGVDEVVAAGMLSLMIGVGLPMRFVGGFLADRVRKNRLRFLIMAAYFMEASGVLLFLWKQTLLMTYVFFILFGLGAGMILGLMNPIRGRYFGRKALGSIAGASAMIMMPVGMAAPIYFGWVYDTTGNYMTAFTLLGILLSCATVIAFFAIPPKPPARLTGVREIV